MMGLLENLNLDGIVDTAKGLAQTGVAKSRQLGELAKLKAANLSEEGEIKKAYLALGKLYYAERGMAPEAAYSALCEKITASKVNIEENRNRMEQLKAESGLDNLADDVKDAGTAFAERAKTAADNLKSKIDDAMNSAAKPSEDDTNREELFELDLEGMEEAQKSEDRAEDSAEEQKDENEE